MNTHTYMAVLGLRGLHCSVRAFSSCGAQLLIAMTAPVAEHGLWAHRF